MNCEHGIMKSTCPYCRARRAPLAKLTWTLAVFALVSCKCGGTAPTPVNPDGPPCVGSGCEPLFPDAGPPASKFTAACANMTRLGCGDVHPNCAAVMAHSTGITVVPADCIAAAQSKQDVRDCGGFARCP